MGEGQITIMFFLLINLALAVAFEGSEWCVDSHTGTLACMAGTPMWAKALNSSSCFYYNNMEERSKVMDKFLDRMSQDECPTREDLIKTGEQSAPAYCVLGAYDYLGDKGGIYHWRIRKDILQLDPRVVEKFVGSNNTNPSDPSGYDQCRDNSRIHLMLPEVTQKCAEAWKGTDLKSEFRRFVKRWAAFECLKALEPACQEVWMDELSAKAWNMES